MTFPEVATTTRRFVPEGKAGALFRTTPALLRRARWTLSVLALLAGFVLLPPAPASADTTAPTLRFVHPANGAPDVPTDRDLVITFSEQVRKGSGNIVIRPASGTVIIGPPPSSPDVTAPVDVTIPVTEQSGERERQDGHHRPHRQPGRQRRIPRPDCRRRDRGPGGQRLRRHCRRHHLALHHRRGGGHHRADRHLGQPADRRNRRPDGCECGLPFQRVGAQGQRQHRHQTRLGPGRHPSP